jgi:glycosyltransferase involved in cell wall biosynthesis
MELSIVLPVYNEFENLELLHQELSDVLEEFGRSYEIIYVDDGSTDGSRGLIETLHERDPHVCGILLRRNFGQTPAVAAGLKASVGEIVVTLDSDRQNDPRDIPRLVAELDKGLDVCSGWRKDRKDDLLLRKIPSLAANKLIRWMTGVHVHDYGCMLKAYRGDIARGMRLYGEMHRFIPSIAHDLGAKVGEIVVNHRARVAGTSKYGISRTVRVILDLLTVKFLSVYATRPLHIFGVFGMISGGFGSLILAVLGFQRIFLGVELGNRPILLLAVLAVMTGIQLVTMGLLGEMLARTYHESQDKPIYVIEKTFPRTAV